MGNDGGNSRFREYRMANPLLNSRAGSDTLRPMVYTII